MQRYLPKTFVNVERLVERISGEDKPLSLQKRDGVRVTFRIRVNGVVMDDLAVLRGGESFTMFSEADVGCASTSDNIQSPSASCT